jgi:hypothetical protein
MVAILFGWQLVDNNSQKKPKPPISGNPIIGMCHRIKVSTLSRVNAVQSKSGNSVSADAAVISLMLTAHCSATAVFQYQEPAGGF